MQLHRGPKHVGMFPRPSAEAQALMGLRVSGARFRNQGRRAVLELLQLSREEI